MAVKLFKKVTTFFTLTFFCILFFASLTSAHSNANSHAHHVHVSSEPFGVAIDEATNRALVTNERDDNVSVVDLATNTVVTTISVGEDPVGIAIDSVTNKAVVTNKRSSTVSIIDLNTYTILATVLAGDNPYGVSINPTTGTAVITNKWEDTIKTVNLTTYTVTKTISVGRGPHGVAINTNTNKAVVVNHKDDSISIVSLATNTVTATISVGNDPTGVAIDRNTNSAIVTNEKDDTITILDLNSNITIATITVGDGPTSVAVNSTTRRAAVSNSKGDSVTIIDLDTHTVLGELQVGKSPEGVAINIATNTLVVTDRKDDQVTIIDLNAAVFTTTTTAGSDPTAVVINSTTNQAVIVNEKRSNVIILDLNTSQTIATIHVGRGPHGVAINTNTNKALVTNRKSNTTSVIDLNTNTVTNTINVGRSPRGVAVNSATNKAYVTNHKEDTISIIDLNTNTVTDTISVGRDPYGIALNPTNNTAIVTIEREDKAEIINLTTKTITHTIPVGNSPTAIAINTQTQQALITNRRDNTLSIIDLTTNTVAATIQVGKSPKDVAINPVTNIALITNNRDNTVTYLNLTSRTVINTIQSDRGPYGVAINTVTNKSVVTNEKEDTITTLQLLDTQPPDIEITAPEDGAILNTQTVSLTGTVADLYSNITSVTVNTVAATLTNDTYTADINLTEGKHSITAIAEDSVGNTKGITITVTLDTTSPGIEITGVTDNQLTNQDITPFITIIDTNLDTQDITLNGQPYVSGTLITEEGTYILEAATTDLARNTTTTIINFTIDKTAPAITITNPPDNSITNQSAIAVTGTIDDNTATVTINSIEATVADTTYTALSIPFTEGSNTITVTATDPAGNTSSVLAAITLDTTPPAITASTTPAPNGAGWNNTDVTVEFTCSDTLSGIAICTDPVTVTTEGAGQVITRTATDNAGNSATIDVTLNIDKMSPVISLNPPVDGSSTSNPAQTFTGSLSEPATLTLNGQPVTVGLNNGFSHGPVTLVEGVNNFNLIATDIADNSSQLNITISLQTDDDGDGVINSLDQCPGTPSGEPVDANGCSASQMDDDNDGVTNDIDLCPNTPGNETADATGCSPSQSLDLPSDPATIAPELDLTVATDIAAATDFLYTGTDPIQTGVTTGTIEAVRVGVLRGNVSTDDGSPLLGVNITILHHPEYGQTLSRTDGMFDMAVNGGGHLTVKYTKDGYLPVQRQVNVPWRDYTLLPDVVMIPYDDQVTTIDLTSTFPVQTARGSIVTDSDGTRQPTILFPQGLTADMTLPDGTTQPLSTLSVRATEYTVGPNGPNAMPAALPPTSAYTYAVELSVDEAVAAGAEEVIFNQPVINYVENFLGFPVGGNVPVGYYNRNKGVWLPSDNGRIIEVLSITGELADVDSDGDAIADDTATLTALGITDTEREELATLYQPGQTLWRVLITHFTPWDFNWGFWPPADAVAPTPEPIIDDPLDDYTCQTGSIIECENQVLGEQVNITGAPYSLHYRSSRVTGRKNPYTISIPVSGPSIPASLKRIELEIQIAGYKYSYTFPASPNQSYEFTWDGQDVYSRRLQGSQAVTVNIGYVYDRVYQGVNRFGYNGNGTIITGNTTRQDLTLWQKWVKWIGPWITQSHGLAGWNMNIHHAYDTVDRTLYLGNGVKRSAETIPNVITTIAGGAQGLSGDEGPAIDAKLKDPRGIAVDSVGNIFIADRANNRIRKIDTDGIITTFAGTTGESMYGGFSGDGGQAIDAELNGPQGVAVDKAGNAYISDTGNFRIRKVSPDGIITTVAGAGAWGSSGGFLIGGYSGDDGPAINAHLNAAQGIAVDIQGNIFIADTKNHRVRKIDPNGIITTVAGDGIAAYSGDGGLAIDAQLKYPESVAVDNDGNLFISDTYNHRVRRVNPDGRISTIAGNGGSGYSSQSAVFLGDGGPATNAKIDSPRGIAVDNQGNLYIAMHDYGSTYPGGHVVRKVNSSGIITTLAGTGIYGSGGDNGPARGGQLGYPKGVAVGPNNNFYIADSLYHRIRSVGAPFSGFSGQDIAIPSVDGNTLYQFDSAGKHLRTINALTGAVIYQFTYDADNLLVQIADGDGNVTTINRDVDGNPTSFVAPDGQITTLGLDTNGYLNSITNPASETTQFTYTNDGLMTAMTYPKETVSTFTYDTEGRLIKDQNAAGGFWELTRTDGEKSFTVDKVSALGRTTTYFVEELSTGDEHRITTDPNGLQTDKLIGTDEITTTTSPDGTITTSTEGPDPRWGMKAPITNKLTVTTPGGFTSTINTGRIVTLADPLDLLSLETQTDKVNINGRLYKSDYDNATLTSTATTPEGRQTVTLLDSQGKVLQENIAGLDPTDFGYDLRGRLTTITEGSGVNDRVSTITYNIDGFVDSITDPLSRSVTFQYDLAGRVTKQTLPDLREINYTYDANGNVTSITPPSRPAHNFNYTPVDLEEIYTPPDIGIGTTNTHYTYNLDKQLTLITRPDGQTVSFDYDTGSRLSSMTIPRGQTDYTYSATTGNLATITAPDNGTLSFTYDGSLLLGSTWASDVNGSVSRVYDNNFWITSRSVNGGNTINFVYDNDSLLTQAGFLTLDRDLLNGLLTSTTLDNITDSLSYNGFGEVTNYNASYTSSSLFDVQYTRNDLGRITQKVETISGITDTYDYFYDIAGRLTDVDKNGVNIANYSYDANSNRTSFTNTSGTVSGTYDDQDRLLSYGGNTYTYTENGELQQKTVNGQLTTVSYDLLGNLMSVILPDTTQIDYVIDGQNRRVGKKINGTLAQGFLYKDQLNPIAELDGVGNVITRFIYGSKFNVPDYMEKNGNVYRIISDHLGSPRLIVGTATGTIVQRIDYDEFGNITFDTNPGFQPFGFAGGIYDVDTGLTRFGVRDYDAETGRWTTKDPIGFSGGDTNLFGYVLNDPVNFVDPFGLIDLISEYKLLRDGNYNRNMSNRSISYQVAMEQWNGNVPAHFHQQGIGNEGNVKYVSPDGHFEAIFNRNGNPVTDPVNGPTYNYADPVNDPIGHFLQDIIPYYIWGTSPDDPTKWYQRLFGTYRGSTSQFYPLQCEN